MALRDEQMVIRRKLEALKDVATPITGRTYLGIPAVDEEGWVHGRRGMYLGRGVNNTFRLECLETGKVFYAIRIVKPKR